MHTSSKGFTLVEVLVVIPIVILVIATIVGAMTLLSGDALVANQRIRLTESVQSALSAIEQDVRMS
jgi:type II secretory pathway pseudopilin PulG